MKPLRQSIQKLQAQLALVQRVSPRYAQLANVQSALQLASTLSSNPATPAGSDIRAVKIAPLPQRAITLGGLAGLALGLVLAFLYEALDDRARSEKEIEESLGVALLGSIPSPSAIPREGELVMIGDPASPTAEAYRQLRVRLELARSETHARTILMTSAVEREGKTTTAANLAVASARAGERVILVGPGPWPSCSAHPLSSTCRAGCRRGHRGCGDEALTSTLDLQATRRLLVVVLVAATASLAWSIHSTAATPTAAHFSTFARAWELALGAALGDRRLQPVAGVAGRENCRGVDWAAGIGAAAVTFSGSTPFPGYAALLPTVGTALVILAGIGGQPRVGVGRVLALGPCR